MIRALRAAGIAALALVLGGCVYLRLLELKRQLGEFDRFFALQTTDGVGLVCQDPVLRPDDLRWMGIKPEHVKTLGRAEHWTVRWVKQLPEGIVEPGTFDIAVELGFANERLTRITIPERYFAMMPKAFLIGVIKSVGQGRIDKSDKQIESAVSAADVAAARPKLPSIDKLLGRASEERAEGATTICRYRYVPATKESRAGVFDMHLTFDTKSGELLRWHGKTPVGDISFNFGQEKKG